MSTTIFEPYIHLVEYCETDAMKIVHHAEYVKWMEYARHDYLLKAGFDWAELEQIHGVMMPILSVNVDYKNMVRFGESVDIYISMEKFNGIYLDFSYVIKKHDGDEVKAMGHTRSGFVDREYHPIILKYGYPEYYEKLQKFN